MSGRSEEIVGKALRDFASRDEEETLEALNDVVRAGKARYIGATKPHHLDDAAAAVAVKLTPEEIHRLEESYQPHPVLGYA